MATTITMQLEGPESLGPLPRLLITVAAMLGALSGLLIGWAAKSHAAKFKVVR